MKTKFIGFFILIFHITTLFSQTKSSDVHIIGHIDQQTGEHTLQALDLSGIVVTGSRNEVNRRESSTIVGVLSTRLFETSGAVCVADVLGFQPGLRVENTCNNCGAPELRINGLSGQYSQILIDGRPIFSSLASVYGLEQFPTGMIERIEVVRGGGSALYGSNAIAGVVNIITKEPLQNSISLSNTTGIFGKGKTDVNTVLNASFVTDDFKTGVYLFGTANNRDAYDRNNDGFSDVHKLRSETLGFSAYYNLTNRSKLTLDYHRINEFRRGGNHLDRPPHEANIAEQAIHQINGGGLKYNLFSKDYKHRFNIYTSMQKINRESYYGTDQDLDAYGFTRDLTFVAGSQYTYSMDIFWFMPADFTGGIEYIDSDLDDQMPAYDRHLKQRAKSFGGYVQNEWKTERFSLSVGARLDKHNLMKNAVFSPRINTRYALNKNVTFRASYSSGYRAPQIFDEDLHVAAVGGEVLLISVDPNLKPEYSNSFNASIDWNKQFGGVATNLLVEGFYTDLKDVFVLEEIENTADHNLHFMRTNAEGAVVQGINFDLNVGITSKLLANAGFTLQRSRYKAPHEWSEDVDPVKQMLRAPNHYGYVALNYTPMRDFTISATGNYTGSMLVPHFAGYIDEDELKKTPSFFEAGLRLAYNFQLSQTLKMEVNAGVKNMFDQFQKDIDNGAFRDSEYIYGPRMPRTIYFGVKFAI